MALNAWQKVTRVLPGKPFGNGIDGNLTVSSSQNWGEVTRSCSGSSGSKTLTIASSAYSNGDVLMIHQSRGTGAGQWEVNRISSGGGSTSLTLQENLQYTYTDSGLSQAQVIKIPQYKTLTVNTSQTLSAVDWGSDTGGIIAYMANVTTLFSGTVNLTGKGYVGGRNAQTPTDGEVGEGTNSINTTRGVSDPGGNGGGTDGEVYGAGGGHGTQGGDGGGGSGTGDGGDTVGDTDLTSINFGGGGAGGSSGTNGTGRNGDGGGIFVAYSREFQAPNAINSNGTNGAYGPGRGGGGGAGGSILICGQRVNIGTNKLSTTGGSGGGGTDNAPYTANVGGKGRVAVYYGLTLTGSLSSTYYGSYTATNDVTLNEFGGGSLVAML